MYTAIKINPETPPSGVMAQSLSITNPLSLYAHLHDRFDKREIKKKY
jgi:hypothetical protein